MHKNVIIALIVGYILGGFITYSIVSSRSIKTLTAVEPKTQSNSHIMPDGSMMKNDDSMSMQGMVDALKGKSGDDFDKEFIKQMIPHHQGAINMATEAQKNAGHDEIKNLADEIIAAQEKEINMMREWQKTWGY